MKSYPEPTVGALIFNPKGDVLLVKSYKWQNKYVIPGGHIELGENIEEALKREVREETGLLIYDIEFLCFHEFIFGENYWKKKHFIFINYCCKTDSYDVILNSEGNEIIWINLLDAFNLKTIEPYSHKVIEAYINKKVLTK